MKYNKYKIRKEETCHCQLLSTRAETGNSPVAPHTIGWLVDRLVGCVKLHVHTMCKCSDWMVRFQLGENVLVELVKNLTGVGVHPQQEIRLKKVP